MSKLWNWMNGNKTYLGMISAGLLGILYSQGWISDQVAATSASIITAWTGIAVRSAVKKIEPLAHVKLKTIITRT